MSRPDRVRRIDRLPALLVAVAAVAVVARLVVLDLRVAHWDEGRVGYGILRYTATGAWEYRPIVHGPFLPRVNSVVFDLFGANDLTMRLVVAIVGGLFPLSAWLYREHLDDVEVLALAVILAVEPVLLYYSRFMRNDVLLAAFVFTALGCYVRLYDTGRLRYLFTGTLLLALAFTTKENVLLYPVCVLGGLVLLLDHRLFLARERYPDWTTVLRRHVGRAARGLWTIRLGLLVALFEFLAVVVFFYAPRGDAGPQGVGFWEAFDQPAMLPHVIEAGTIGAAQSLVDSWITGTHQDHAYLPYLGHYLEVLVTASGGLVILAVIGFLADRYRGERPRDLVSLGFYWGFVSVLGYPIVMDIQAAWMVTHAVVPLAIPAAAGVALFYGWGLEALERDDRLSVALSVVVLLLLVGQLPAVAVQTSYVAPQQEGNVMVQYAQPEGDFRPALGHAENAVRQNDGVDVVWYNEHFYISDEGDAERLPAPSDWYHRLPMPWYLERMDADRTSVDDPDELRELVDDERPPVILTRAQEREDVDDNVEGYQDYTYEFRQRGEDLVIYVDEEYTEGEPPPLR